MQITIKQAEIEEALRHHLSRMGITGEIQEVSFTQSRSEGQLITNIEVGTRPDVDNEPTSIKQVESKPWPKQVEIAIDPAAIVDEQSSTKESMDGDKPISSGQSIFS